MIRCIDNRCTDVHFNLAAEEYLLKQKRDNYLMVWQSSPCVVVGKHQHVPAEVDEDYLHQRGILLARRFSGGGAVYHDEGNVNLTFIETTLRPDFDYYLQHTLDFLEELGISTTADNRMGIYLDGLKISGSAQCIHKDRVMYHCTLLFDTDLTVLRSSLLGSEDSSSALAPGSTVVRAMPSVKSEVTNIRDHLPERLSVKRFVRRLLHHFLEEDDANILYRFTDADLKSIQALKTIYATDEWTYKKRALIAL